MKKLKLMALGLMFLMIQNAVAVTLPSTSYTPYAGGGSESSEVVFSSGSMISGSYSSLGTVDPGVCTTSEPSVPAYESNCSDCCDIHVLGPCEDEKGTNCDELNVTCINSCMQGGSLPLDGGLSILLALALGSGAVRVLRKK